MESYNLINTNIITRDSNSYSSQSITIHNGKIESINQTNSKYKTIDLEGATTIPGFIDAHFHLKNFGKRLDMLNLKGLDSLDAIIKKIREKLRTVNAGDWLVGYGWDQNLWENKKYPKSELLNSIAPHNPIYLTRIDGHSAWVNKAAICLTKQSLDAIAEVDGGNLINDCIIIDNSMDSFKSILPKDSKKKIKSWIKIGLAEIVQKGITCVHDAWQDGDTIDVIKELIEEEEFPIRCYGMLGSSNTALLEDFFSKEHYSSPYYNIRSVKAFIDGALGSRGAALYESYSDDKNNCGLILITQDEFLRIADLCYKNNYQLNTHAIGDRGNAFVLDCYAQILKGKNNRRWRIEHAQMVSDSDILKFKDFDILPSMQPSHCTSDMPWLHDRLGNHRLKLISRWQSFINLGLKIPGGSDCPIEEGNPLFEFYAAVTRQNHQGLPAGGWQPQEKVNTTQALKMFTEWAAYGAFQEKFRGKIEVGYDADLTVLSDNILNMNPLDILKIKITYTIVNGRIVFSKL